MSYYVTPEQYEIAAKNGLSRGNVYSRVYVHGWDIERAITEPLSQRNAHGWKERKATAKQNGISYSVYLTRVTRLGWDYDKAASVPVMSKKEVTEMMNRNKKRAFTSEEIQTAKRNGISYQTLYQRVYKSGWDIDKAITMPTMSRKEVIQIAISSQGSFRTKRLNYGRKTISGGR